MPYSVFTHGMTAFFASRDRPFESDRWNVIPRTAPLGNRECNQGDLLQLLRGGFWDSEGDESSARAI